MSFHVRNLLFIVQFAGWILLFAACKKEDGITPQTGNLVITLKPSRTLEPTNYISYSLYTETAYFAAINKSSALWLKRGSSGVSRIEVKGLHPGNYVIVVQLVGGRVLEASVQVVARQTNEFEL